MRCGVSEKVSDVTKAALHQPSGPQPQRPLQPTKLQQWPHAGSQPWSDPQTYQHTRPQLQSILQPQQPWLPQQHSQQAALDTHQHPHHDPQLLRPQQQQLPSHSLQQQQQQQRQPCYRHQTPFSRSLADALHVTPSQAQAMLQTYPALGNYNHTTLAYKLQELSSLLQVQPQQLGPALVGAPKVLGFSLQQLERRLVGLAWIQPDKRQLSQLVLEAPQLLTWSARQLHARLDTMATLLHISPSTLASLLQQHPMLLPSSSNLRQTLHLLQQLFLLAAASEQAGFGSGVLAKLAATQQHSTVLPPAPQQQQGAAAAAAMAAARQFALEHVQLLLVEPQVLQVQMACMQATSGLSAAQVAAMLISQPDLLLSAGAAAADTGGGPAGRRRGPQP